MQVQEKQIADPIPVYQSRPTLLSLSARTMTLVFLACFCLGSIRFALNTPLWMDEILAVWVIRMHSLSEILSALRRGAEFSPPTYHLLLHWFAGVAGFSTLALRLPSILAMCLFGWFLFQLLHRYLGAYPALFGVAASLLGVTGGYAAQVRPYAFLLAVFSYALVLWSDLSDGETERQRRSSWRPWAIAVLLAFAVSLHFYAVLLVALFGLLELLWSLVHRRVRFSLWAALFAGGAFVVVWLPLLHVLSRFNSGDTRSPEYYAKPTLSSLLHSVASLFLYENRQALFLLSAASIVALLYCLRALRLHRDPSRTALSHLDEELPPIPPANFFLIAFTLTAFPLMVFVFARFVTGTFNLRYILVASIGTTFLMAFLFSRTLLARPAAALTLVPACLLTFVPLPAVADIEPSIAKLIARVPVNRMPIVVGEGFQFLELQEMLEEPTRSRLVFLTDVPGIPSADPTNENQVKRWFAINPRLAVEQTRNFLLSTHEFYVLHTGSSMDSLTPWLVREHVLMRPVANVGDAWVFEAKSY